MIRFSIGSQWSFFNQDVMWSNLRPHNTSRSAQFWTGRTRWIRYLGRPNIKELQWSSLDITKAWTKHLVFSTDTKFRSSRDITDMKNRWLANCNYLTFKSKMIVKDLTPISLAEKEGLMMDPSCMSCNRPKEIEGWCWGLIIKSSILSPFSFS